MPTCGIWTSAAAMGAAISAIGDRQGGERKRKCVHWRQS